MSSLLRCVPFWRQEKQECIAKEEGPAAEQCAEPQAFDHHVSGCLKCGKFLRRLLSEASSTGAWRCLGLRSLHG